MNKLIVTIAICSLGIASCGPSKEEVQKKEALRKQEVKDSIRRNEDQFSVHYNELKEKLKSQLVPDGDYFFDYTAGSVEVPAGCVWQLGKYNVWARKWDTVKINDPNIFDPCDRIRIKGDGKPMYIGEESVCIDVNKIAINNIPMTIPAAPCGDDNSATINNMTGNNTNWNRLMITNVFLTPGTRVFIPSNRFDRTTGSHGILTIKQFKIKDPGIISEFERMVVENKKIYGNRVSYPTWKLTDSIGNLKLDVIGEISNNLNWYKPF